MATVTREEVEAKLDALHKEEDQLTTLLEQFDSVPEEPDVAPPVVFVDVEQSNGKPGRNPVTTYTLYRGPNDLWMRVNDGVALDWDTMWGALSELGTPKLYGIKELEEIVE